jgi:hypothetical protein
MVMTGRRTIAAGAVLAAIAGGAVIARAQGGGQCPASASKGLGVCSSLIEKPLATGTVATVTVYNGSAGALDVTVRPRPWVQSSSGAVAVNRRATLAGVAVSDDAFSLAAHSKKAITVTLASRPASGSLYGGLEIVGLPPDAAKQKGVVVGYRLISSLRLNPATAVLSLKAGTAKAVGSGAARAVVLPVRNAGNTVQPVSAAVSLKGPLGTRRRSISGLRILPGKTVNLLLSSAKSLPAGSYTATVKLKQGTQTGTVTKKLRITR